MSDSDGDVSTYLADHPRLLGALFTMFLLLSQASTAAASNGAVIIG